MRRTHSEDISSQKATKRIRLHNEAEVRVISLDVFDQRVTEIKELRRFSEEEKFFISQSRRMIRNRYYAKQSRLNKTNTIIELGETIVSLRKEIDALKLLCLNARIPTKCEKEESAVGELTYASPHSLFSNMYEEHIEWF